MLFRLDGRKEAFRAFSLRDHRCERGDVTNSSKRVAGRERINRGQPIQGKEGSVRRSHQESNIQEPATI